MLIDLIGPLFTNKSLKNVIKKVYLKNNTKQNDVTVILFILFVL